MLALKRGNRTSAAAQTFIRTAVTVSLPPLRSADLPFFSMNGARPVISASSNWVTWGTMRHAAPVFSAVRRRTVSSFSVCTLPQRLKSGSRGREGSAGPAALFAPDDLPLIRCLTYALTSAWLIRPSRPLPVTSWISTPSSRARRRTDGAAGTGCMEERSAECSSEAGTGFSSGFFSGAFSFDTFSSGVFSSGVFSSGAFMSASTEDSSGAASFSSPPFSSSPSSTSILTMTSPTFFSSPAAASTSAILPA